MSNLQLFLETNFQMEFDFFLNLEKNYKIPVLFIFLFLFF